MTGTVVLTTLGQKTIETIQVGDTVPCVDHITGDRAEKRVVSTSVNKTDTLVDLVIAGETIHTTTAHPFQVKGKGWVDACKLQVGDLIYDKDWNTAPVEKIEIITLADPVEVYNFEVEDFHTYFVGNSCWLVHNGGCRGEAVRKAWKNEYNNVKNGGNGISRTWTPDEKAELLANGKIKGYVGHHMKSVRGYPDLAGEASNIQFLTRLEHFKAHSFNWRTITHGFFEYWK